MLFSRKHRLNLCRARARMLNEGEGDRFIPSITLLTVVNDAVLREIYVMPRTPLIGWSFRWYIFTLT